PGPQSPTASPATPSPGQPPAQGPAASQTGPRPGAPDPRLGGNAPQPGAAAAAGLDELRSQRRERVEEGGRRTIIEEPGERTIIREGDRVIIRHDETERFRRAYRDADLRTERRGAEEVTILRRPNGVEVVTVRDAQGNLVRRVRREPGGAETVLIENEVRSRPRTTVIEETVELPPP